MSLPNLIQVRIDYGLPSAEIDFGLPETAELDFGQPESEALFMLDDVWHILQDSTGATMEDMNGDFLYVSG